MSDIGETKKVKVQKKDDKLEGRVCALERLVGKAIKWMETVHGADIDQDGKIGMARIKSVIMIALVAAVTAVIPLVAENETDDKYIIDRKYENNAVWGTYFVKSDLAGEATLVVDVIEAAAQASSTDTTTNVTLTASNYGATVMLSATNAIAVTLPANGAPAGSWLEVAVIGTDATAPTISAATADTLIGPNDPDLDSVTWGTGHRINALARFWSDGSFWHVQNLGGTTMTYTD